MMPFAIRTMYGTHALSAPPDIRMKLTTRSRLRGGWVMPAAGLPSKRYCLHNLHFHQLTPEMRMTAPNAHRSQQIRTVAGMSNNRCCHPTPKLAAVQVTLCSDHT